MGAGIHFSKNVALQPMANNGWRIGELLQLSIIAAPSKPDALARENRKGPQTLPTRLAQYWSADSSHYRRVPRHFPSLTRRVLINAQHQNLPTLATTEC